MASGIVISSVSDSEVNLARLPRSSRRLDIVLRVHRCSGRADDIFSGFGGIGGLIGVGGSG